MLNSINSNLASFIILFKTGRVENGHAKVSGHKGRVLDLQWNPFNENLIASASEDCTVKVSLRKHLHAKVD